MTDSSQPVIRTTEEQFPKPSCPACNSVGMRHCAHPEHCGNVLAFGPCKDCGSPLVMVRIRDRMSRELDGRLFAACLACDVVRERTQCKTCEHGTPLTEFCDPCRAYLLSPEGQAELVAFGLSHGRQPHKEESCPTCGKQHNRQCDDGWHI